MIISAGVIAPRAEVWMGNGSKGSILHLFPRVCNLVDERGRVLSLVAESVGPGPFAMVLPIPGSFSKYMAEKSPVIIQEKSLHVGSLTVNTAKTSLWKPCPAWQQLQENLILRKRFRGLINALVLAYHIPETAVSRATKARLSGLNALLKHALAANDFPALAEIARQAAGLGAGLTPSGDDYLLGCIYGIWATMPAATARKMVKCIVETAVPLTTKLSAAWLEAAADGEAGQPWHDLVDAILVASTIEAERAVKAVLHTGHSSGLDALMGFTAVFV